MPGPDAVQIMLDLCLVFFWCLFVQVDSWGIITTGTTWRFYRYHCSKKTGQLRGELVSTKMLSVPLDQNKTHDEIMQNVVPVITLLQHVLTTQKAAIDARQDIQATIKKARAGDCHTALGLGRGCVLVLLSCWGKEKEL